MVSDAERGVEFLLRCATNWTSPLPPVPEEEIVSQLGSLVNDVHEQAAGAITPTRPLPPAAGTLPFADCNA